MDVTSPFEEESFLSSDGEGRFAMNIPREKTDFAQTNQSSRTRTNSPISYGHRTCKSTSGNVFDRLTDTRGSIRGGEHAKEIIRRSGPGPTRHRSSAQQNKITERSLEGRKSYTKQSKQGSIKHQFSNLAATSDGTRRQQTLDNLHPVASTSNKNAIRPEPHSDKKEQCAAPVIEDFNHGASTEVGDMITEIAERIRESHQEELKVAEDRRRRLEIELCHAIEKTTADLTTSKAYVHSLQSEIENLKDEVETKRNDLRLIEDLATDLEGELAASHKTTNALEDKVVQLQQAYEQSENDTSAARASIDSLRNEIASLQTKMTQARNHQEQTIEMLETQVSVLKTEKLSLDTVVREQDTNLKEAATRQKRLYEDFELQKEQLRGELSQKAEQVEKAMTVRLADLETNLHETQQKHFEEHQRALNEAEVLRRQICELKIAHQTEVEELKACLVDTKREATKLAAQQETSLSDLRNALAVSHKERDLELKSMAHKMGQSHKYRLAKLQRAYQEELDQWKNKYLVEHSRADAVLSAQSSDTKCQAPAQTQHVKASKKLQSDSVNQGDRLKEELLAVGQANSALKVEANNLIARINAMNNKNDFQSGKPSEKVRCDEKGNQSSGTSQGLANTKALPLTNAVVDSVSPQTSTKASQNQLQLVAEKNGHVFTISAQS